MTTRSVYARRPLYTICKRVVDLTIALCAGVLTAPIWLVTALLIRCRMGTPILFRQPRAGYHGQTFELFKFRTMRHATDSQGQPLPDAERLTALGKWLRRWSLDELPQLWNVIRGDMSLVGPRPLLVQYLRRYTPEQRRRHDVLPGITGWAQVHGRNAISWDEKFALDVWYVEHASFGLDMVILLKTLAVAVGRHGVSAAEHATMPEFLGNSPSHASNSPVHNP